MKREAGAFSKNVESKAGAAPATVNESRHCVTPLRMFAWEGAVLRDAPTREPGDRPEATRTALRTVGPAAFR